MPIHDDDIEWLRRRVYIPAANHHVWKFIAEATGTGSAQNFPHNLGATPDIVIAMQTGQDTTLSDIAFGTHTEVNAVITQPDSAQLAAIVAGITPVEISTFGVSGITMLQDDKVFHVLRVPADVNPAFEVGFRVHFTSASTTAADDFQFIVLADFKAANSSATTSGAALVAPTTALDTAIAATTWIDTTAFKNQWSPRGVKNKDFLIRSQIEDGAALMYSVEAQVADDTVIFLGVEIDYAPYATRGGGRSTDSQMTATGAL